MTKFRVSISNMSASYAEKHEANSRHEAEQQARQRWEREFGDASAFHFYAKPDKPSRDEEDE